MYVRLSVEKGGCLAALNLSGLGKLIHKPMGCDGTGCDGTLTLLPFQKPMAPAETFETPRVPRYQRRSTVVPR
jgi:hypothetical protein